MYSTVVKMRESRSLMDRSSAAVATEQSSNSENSQNSGLWVSERSWDIASTPGWTAKWESAEAGGIVDPGANEGVITDGDILSRIQQLLATYPLTASPVP